MPIKYQDYVLDDKYKKSALIGWFRSGASLYEISWLSELELKAVKLIITNYLKNENKGKKNGC